MPKPRGAQHDRKTEELMLHYHLARLAQHGAVGEFRGVVIDLRSDLDPKVWQPISPLGLYGHTAALYGPEIIFPWTDAGWREHYARRGETVLAAPGSRVWVERVDTQPIASAFDQLDHPGQREAKRLYLVVTSPEGDVTRVRQPLLMLQTTAVANLVTLGDFREAYLGMLARMEQVFEVEDIEAIADGPPQALPMLPSGASKAYGYAFLALRERDADVDGYAMAAFGYMLGRAEAEELLAPAKRGVAQLENTQKASAAKSAKDRAASEPLRARARQIIAEDPNISLSRCARHVADEFQKDPRWVSSKLKELFEKRPGGREYRPKRIVGA